MSSTPHVFSRRLTRLSAAALIALGGALGLSVAAATPALAHDKLVSYSTSDDAIRLTFNNEVLEVGAEILVTDESGGDVADGAPEMDGPDVTQKLRKELPDGDYTVDWRVVSSDGHPIQGLLDFTVSRGEIVTLEPVVTDEEAEHDHDHADDEHADHDHGDDHGDDASAGPGAATVIAVAVGAVVIVAGVITVVALNNRRRKQAQAAPAERPDDQVDQQSGE